MKRNGSLLSVLFLISTPFMLLADDWPQWRGPKLDSVSSEASIPGDIAAEGALKWRLPLPGPGGSSPIVAKGKVFITTVDGNQNGDPMYLYAIATDGQVSWKQDLEGENRNVRDNANSASPSPFTDGEHVWATTCSGILHCFTMDGELVWKTDLQKEYGKFDIQFGMASSPILDRGRIYLQLIHGDMRNQQVSSEGHVVALDAKTGKQIWYQKRLTDGVAENVHSYASPCIYRDDEREFLVTHGADYVIGHSLEDGAEIWRVGGINIKGPRYNPYLRFVASPTCVPGMIVAPSAKRGPVIALKPDLQGVATDKEESQHWKMDVGTPDVASPVVYQGLVYLAGEGGDLTCIDAENGETLYQKRRFLAGNHRSTPVAADGKIILTSRDGQIYILQAGREFNVLSNRSLDEETTASVAVSDGVIYVRTYEAVYAFGNP